MNLTEELEKYFKLSEVCELLSDELQTRYFLKYKFLTLFMVTILTDKLKIKAETKDVETAYRLATADLDRQINKLIKHYESNKRN